jgi:hypothetical protein
VAFFNNPDYVANTYVCLLATGNERGTGGGRTVWQRIPGIQKEGTGIYPYAILYLGCMIVMATAGREASIFFFNSLMHGIDVTSIIRMDMPLWEAGIGIVEIFILGWLSGASIAGSIF